MTFRQLHHKSTYKRAGYTQSEEETYILDNLPNTGRFLDIGAYDGRTYSNTKALLDKGWKGVYVEPCPNAIKLLTTNTTNFANKIQIVQAAISNQEGKQTFYASSEMVGTLNPSNTTRWKQQGMEYTPLEVNVMTPKTLLEQIGYEFDMVSIDAEGNNAKICNAFPWEAVKPTLIVIEHDYQIRAIEGYEPIFVNCENAIFVRKRPEPTLNPNKKAAPNGNGLAWNRR